MGTSSSQLPPVELATFKRLPDNFPPADIHVPELSENRERTDLGFLIALGIFILIFLPFLIYTLYYSDISVIFFKSQKSAAYQKRRSANGYNMDVGSYLDSVKFQLILGCLLSILISMGMLFLFRYAISLVVWGMLWGTFICLLILVVVIWLSYSILASMPLSAIAVICSIVLIWFRKKISLVVQLLKETTKAVFDMRRLTLLPVICGVFLLILSGLYVVATLFIVSAILTTGSHQSLQEYNQVVINCTLIYSVVLYLWLVQFFIGIQYMIVAGAVSKWYFTRDKTLLDGPIMRSTSIAFRFHLGSVAFGGLLIGLFQIVKLIVHNMMKNESVKTLCKICWGMIETFLRFLSKNAYIIIAMHGQPFIRSGRRAAKLIYQNISDIIAVNYIGDFVLIMAKLLIVIITLMITAGILTIFPGDNIPFDYPAYIFVGIFAFLAANLAFGVFETTIDTIFICYCEDKMANDGVNKPYFMSRNMAEFVENSMKVYKRRSDDS